MKRLLFVVMLAGILFSCADKPIETTLSGLKKSDFESVVDGKNTNLYVLTNKNGAEACVTNYGGRWVSMMVPDKNGKMTDVVLGYDNIADYVASNGNFGGLIGRYGNRIANAQFVLDGETYQLPANNNGHCLHGGPNGYHTRMWDGKQIDSQTVELTYLSVDNEAGFPGNLNIKVTYTLTDDNAMDIRYEATTDKPTIVNLTNHSYFNLSGDLSTPVSNQLIMIDADYYTPVNETLIPLGEIASVEGTPMDLRQAVAIGAHIDDNFQDLIFGGGYDHNWILNTKGNSSAVAIKAYSPANGIGMEVYTNEPGVQLYTGNFLNGGDIGKHGIAYPHRGAFCLETQHYPNSPNRPDFPSTVLRPGEKYFSQCTYKFTVE